MLETQPVDRKREANFTSDCLADWEFQQGPTPEPIELSAPTMLGNEPGQVSFLRLKSPSGDRPFEVIRSAGPEDHSINLSLRRSSVYFRIGQQVICDRAALPGEIVMAGPYNQASHAIWGGGFDMVRIGLPTGLLQEAIEALTGKPRDTDVELFDAHLASDEVIQQLVMSVMAVTGESGECEPIFLHSIGLALAVHLVGRYGDTARFGSRRSTPLSPARLKRVIDYIEARLAEEMTLVELSHVAGLSRMHFAAQFKAATGLSPHSFLLRRRIDASQALLTRTSLPVRQVASAVGFKSDAHFNNVFRRIAGTSPGRWREHCSTP